MTTIQTSTQGLVIGLIYKLVQGLDLASVIGRPCPVFDGPNGTDNEDYFVVVHGWPGEEATGQRANYAGLGAKAMDENYDVAVAIWGYDGGISGPDATGANDAQAAVRANVVALAAAIEVALRSDITLATINGGATPIPSGWTTLAEQSLSQALPESANGMGVFAAVTMRVHVRARLLAQ